VLPPPLPALEASEAIAAWLALGAPTDGSAPAPRAQQEAGLRALLTRLSDTEIPRLIEPLFARSGPDAFSLRQTALGLWMHRHPAAVAAWTLTAELPAEDQTRYHLARQAGMYWAGRDLPAAIAWAEKIPDPALATGVLEMILPQFAARDPLRALALAEAQGPEFLAKVRDSLFEHWAQKDPPAALARFGREFLDADSTSYQVAHALGEWMQRDMPAALAWLDAEGSGGDMQRLNLLNNAVIPSAHKPGQAAPLADALLRQPDFPHKQSTLNSLLQYWQQQDPEAAQKWLTRVPDAAERADLIEKLVPAHWYDHMKNPEGLLPLALTLPPGEARDARLSTLVTTWAKTDPAAAAAWLEQHEKSDPTLASAAARVEGGLVAALATVDPAAARVRYEALPPGPARLAAAPEIALAWSAQDPAAAARWLEQELPSISQQKLGNLAQYARYGPNHVVEDSEARITQILGQSTRAWFAREPEAALAWAEAIPDPNRQSLALLSLGSRNVYGDENSSAVSPERHAALLSKIQNPAQREITLGMMLSTWINEDRATARAWLETHDALSPESTARLLLQATPPPR
jgi:hypothetical protein